MAAVHYGQFFDSSYDGQTQDDDWRVATTPQEIRDGAFRFHYIPFEQFGDARCLLSVATATNEFSIALTAGDGEDRPELHISLDGVTLIAVGGGAWEFAAGAALTFIVDATLGKLTIAGAISGNGDYFASAPWELDDGALRIGGSILGGVSARGYVSVPYAISGAAADDAGDGDAGAFHFNNPAQSGHLINLF